jgi:hypothetical protein
LKNEEKMSSEEIVPSKMKVAELKEELEKRGVTGLSGLKKAELVTKLEESLADVANDDDLLGEEEVVLCARMRAASASVCVC